jgi:hypothetical protein
MSRLPAILNAIMRKVDAPKDSAAPPEGRDDIARDEPAPSDVLRPLGIREDSPLNEVLRKFGPGKTEPRENVFSLVAPDAHRPDPPAAEGEKPEPEPAESERNVRPIGGMDLARLSIDNDGRLYWDGKPVEVRRRIMMSRRQIVGASVIGLFVAIGAVGAAIQGTAAARDWACRLGWIENTCAMPEAPLQGARFDIPA